MDRRSFLKGLGTAAAAAPFVSMPKILAAPANDRITVGVIGTGGMATGHLRNLLKMPSVQVIAVCDVDSRKMENAYNLTEQAYANQKKSGQYKGCAKYRDFRDMLARPDLDAVVIGTPDHWHATMSVMAANAGKDIYCEKPLTLTIGESRDIINKIRRTGCVFQTGMQQRTSYGGKFITAVQLVRNSMLGKMISAHVTVGGPSSECTLPAEPTPEWMDWDMWLGPAPYRPYNSRLHPGSWRSYRDYSGGVLTDWGAHHFDIVQWAMDADQSGPVRICPPGHNGCKTLTYWYSNGVRVEHGGFEGSGYGITFVGTNGKVSVCRDWIRSDPADLLINPSSMPGDLQLPDCSGHIGNWLDCIRTRRRPAADVEIGARSVTVCQLGCIAYWLDKPLKWNPKTWHFENDPVAEAWIDRPKRAPWTL